MASSTAPIGFIPLSNLAGWKLLDLRTVAITGGIGLPLLLLSLTITNDLTRLLSMLVALILIASALSILLRELRPFQCIAVNLAHPWVEDDHDVERAEVALQIAPEEWCVLADDCGMIKLSDDSKDLFHRSEESIVELTSFESRILASRVVQWLNHAISLRDAQNSSGDDPIEAARSREQQESVMLQRKWADTTSGQFQVTPGILFRGRTSSLEDDKAR